MTNYSIQSIVNSLFTNTQNIVIYRKTGFRVLWRKRTMTSNKLIMLVLQSSWVKVVKKFLKFLNKIDIHWSLKCKLLLFKCRLTVMALWQIKCIFSLEQKKLIYGYCFCFFMGITTQNDTRNNNFIAFWF